jgi:hypothetical protein
MNTAVQLHPAADPFDDFWRLVPDRYGRKNGKALAKQVFAFITSPEGYQTRMKNRESGEYVQVYWKATPEELIAGMKAYRLYVGAERNAGRTAYVQDGSTWLNRGGWLDE